MKGKILLLKNRTTPRDPYHEVFLSSGYEPTFIPLLKHCHVDRETSTQYLMSDDFLQTPVFIITSQRAVECLNECMEHVSSNIKPLIYEKIVYTVGPATTKVLHEAGFSNIRGGADAGNGSVLSDIIIADIEKYGAKKMVFFTGEIRKDIIPRKLKGANIDLKEKVIYKTEDRDDIVTTYRANKDNVEWVVFFSPQGTQPIVEHLLSIEPNQKGPLVASIGPTTEEYLKENNIRIDTVASKPDANSLLQAIIAFRQ